MDNAELGKRLKAARLAKKMTQSDVVGSFITRNMLSQIESGTATPSMKTLEYLAGVLELSIEKLLSDSSPSLASEQDMFLVLQDAKTYLAGGQYLRVLEISTDSGIEDELHALRSMAHYALAEQLAESGDISDLQEAVSHASSAAEEAKLGFYANDYRAEQASALITRYAKQLSEYYSGLAAGK